MTLDRELRDVLTEQADRREGPVPDLAALRAGGASPSGAAGGGWSWRRPRSPSSCAWASGVGLAAGQRDIEATDLPAGPPLGVSAGSQVPWCVPAPDQELEQLIEGEGAPIRTLCRTFHVAELWHHVGTTVLTRNGRPTGSPTVGSPDGDRAPETSE